MAQTTMHKIYPEDGWVEIAKDAKEVSIKANTGNWKSWRVYVSGDYSTPSSLSGSNDDPGDLYNGNVRYLIKSFSGSLFLSVLSEPIVFSITIKN